VNKLHKVYNTKYYTTYISFAEQEPNGTNRDTIICTAVFADDPYFKENYTTPCEQKRFKLAPEQCCRSTQF